MAEATAIVGLGLMGGSLALALKRSRPDGRLIGIDVNRAALDAAVAAGGLDAASSDLKAVAQARLIILAAPVRTILRQIPLLIPIACDGALLLDLGSTKRQIVAAMDALPERLSAVGGHPMCGKETSGFAAAEGGLFAGKPFVLTPSARSSSEALERAARLVVDIGAYPVLMDAERHDRIVAAASHLPFASALALFDVVSAEAERDGKVWELASSGFRDTTRLAASDASMMLDILLTNPDNVSGLARLCSERLAEFANLVEQGKEAELRAILQDVSRRRRTWTEASIVRSASGEESS
ncbi:MAG: prephenate dehydrogenase [Rudaea sp.]